MLCHCLFRFLLCLVAVCACGSFVTPSAPALRRESSDVCMRRARPPRRTADEVWRSLQDARTVREQIKVEIVDVIQKQRECGESSQQYLDLERKFLELLEREDAVVLWISELVNEMIRANKFSRNVSQICRAYFKEA